MSRAPFAATVLSVAEARDSRPQYRLGQGLQQVLEVPGVLGVEVVFHPATMAPSSSGECPEQEPPSRTPTRFIVPHPTHVGDHVFLPEVSVAPMSCTRNTVRTRLNQPACDAVLQGPDGTAEG